MLKALLVTLVLATSAPLVWAATTNPSITVLTVDEFNRRF
jgi:hypothetical protein